MTFALKLEGLELEARDIMYDAFEHGWDKDNNWGWVERDIAKAFNVDPYTAREGAAWIRLAEALAEVEFYPKAGKSALNRLVRYGAIRSYVEGGKRWYEINFKSDTS